MLHHTTPDGISVRISALPHGIVHVQTGGLDGFQESLLNRYGIIENLPELPDTAVDGKTLRLPDGLTVTLTDGLGIQIEEKGQEILHTLPSTRIATGPTRYQNHGYAWTMSIHADEKFVGGGDHYRQGFLLNGHADSLWIRYPVKHVPVPFFMSSRGYGLFFNTTRKLTYDIGCKTPGEAAFYVADDYLDVYIIFGDDFNAMVNSYTTLTGKPKVAPLKSFGLWLLMHTVATGHDVLEVAKTLREAGIPCDNLSLEPDWMQMRYDFSVDKEWSSSRFRGCPSGTFRRGPDRMIDALKRMGFDLGLWLCCRHDLTWEEERRMGDGARQISPGGGELKLDGIEIGHEDENVGHSPLWMDDITKRDESWFEHLKKFVDDGVRFFKLDPASLINEFPDRLYANGCHDDEMHNIAFMLASKQMCEDYEAYTGRRSYGISVAGWAGVQRYPGTWAGDTGGGGQSMVGILQDAVVGHPYATCDMETSTVDGIHMGFLLPWALINSWASFEYPGYQGETMNAVFRDYSRLRMRLLPYFYSLSFAASRTGKAICQPLFMAYPNEDVAYRLTQQFMIGDSLLASVYSNEKITLPAGRWYDFWTGAIFEGDWTEQTIQVPENRGGHLLVREGALIPTIEPMQHTGERKITDIEWLYFPTEAPSAFCLYLDDGDSLNYRKGAYGAATLRVHRSQEMTVPEWSVVEGDEPARITSLNHTFRILGAESVER